MSNPQKNIFLLKERIKEAKIILRKTIFSDNEKSIYLKTKLKNNENIIKSLNESLRIKERVEIKLQTDLREGKKSLITKNETNLTKELESLKLRESDLQNKINLANKKFDKLLKEPKRDNRIDLDKHKDLKNKLEIFEKDNFKINKLLEEERLKINELEIELNINGFDQTNTTLGSEILPDQQHAIIDGIESTLEEINSLIKITDKIIGDYFEPDPLTEARNIYKEIMKDETSDEKADDQFERIINQNNQSKLAQYGKFTNSNLLEASKGLDEMRMKNLQLEIEARNSQQDLENLEGQNKTSAGEYIGGASFFVSFSDVISVLLCFFVVFFAIGELDAEKFNRLLSTFSGDEIRPDKFNARVSNDEFAMLERVKQLVHDNVDPESIIRGDTRTIEHIISGSDLFPPGEFTISQEGRDLLKQKIENDLRNGVKQIIVEGHTDNKELILFPEALDIYKNNLAFSAVRAGAVAQLIEKDLGSPKELISVTGYGASRPLKSNTSDLNRALNRRVVIKILKADITLEPAYSFDNLTGEESDGAITQNQKEAIKNTPPTKKEGKNDIR